MTTQTGSRSNRSSSWVTSEPIWTLDLFVRFCSQTTKKNHEMNHEPESMIAMMFKERPSITNHFAETFMAQVPESCKECSPLLHSRWILHTSCFDLLTISTNTNKELPPSCTTTSWLTHKRRTAALGALLNYSVDKELRRSKTRKTTTTRTPMTSLEVFTIPHRAVHDAWWWKRIIFLQKIHFLKWTKVQEQSIPPVIVVKLHPIAMTLPTLGIPVVLQTIILVPLFSFEVLLVKDTSREHFIYQMKKYWVE